MPQEFATSATSTTPQIAVRLPADEYNTLVTEIKETDPTLSPTEFVRNLIRARDTFEIRLSPDAQQLKIRYEAKIEMLEQDKADLLNKLMAAGRDAGLSGLQQQVNGQADNFTKMLADHRKEWEQETAAKEHKTTAEQLTKVTAELEEAKTKLAELEADQELEKKIEKGIGFVAEASSKLLSNPIIMDKFRGTTLGGLLLGPGDAPGRDALTSDQLEDLELGASMRTQFPGDRLGVVVEVLHYLGNNFNVVVSITKTPGFVRHMQLEMQRRQQAA